ncbi:hypothetical protein QNJ25_03715 [Macrococcus caseolyticus]|uniref:hypothetical protein n=1 Tax=Macrococcoides caseolyticum TaxID=69966 RepID=UPI0024BCC43D|nr:hypothetical protein [Macrococcus caseolyticus]MDJ1153025.1 hypothetical protein [Macrococcus caseolyticus]
MNNKNIINVFEIFNKDGERIEQSTLRDFLNSTELILLDITKSELDLSTEYEWIEDNLQEVLLKVTMNLSDPLLLNILKTNNRELEILKKRDINNKDKYISFINLLCNLEIKLDFITKIKEEKDIKEIIGNYDYVEVAA